MFFSTHRRNLPCFFFEMIKGLPRSWPAAQPNSDRTGAFNAPPPPPPATSQTNDSSRTGEVGAKTFLSDVSKAYLIFSLKDTWQPSGQGQVKGQNWVFSNYGSQNHMCKPNWSSWTKLGRKVLSKVRWWYCMSINFYLVRVKVKIRSRKVTFIFKSHIWVTWYMF